MPDLPAVSACAPLIALMLSKAEVKLNLRTLLTASRKKA
jgi:hypothetical protein